MKPESQRIAIAEACGWSIKACLVQRGYALYTPGGAIWTSFWDAPKDAVKEKLWEACGDQLPDYLNDLNAMHEAEKVIGINMRSYLETLQRVVDETCGGGAYAHTATAAQRAEAFLRTLNLWRDET